MVWDNPDQANDTFIDGKIKVGDRVGERTVNAHLGRVTDISTRQSRVFTVDSAGEIVQTTRPNHSYMIITIEGEGVFPSNGGVLINGMQFLRNRSYEIMIGDSLFFLRLVEIERIEST
jgi:hypothetical protein